MEENIMHRLSINRAKIFVFLFSIMPLMDSLNGIVMRSEEEVLLSVGQVYRFFLLFMLLYFVHKNVKKSLLLGVIIFELTLLILSCLHIYLGLAFASGTELVQVYVWGLCPLVIAVIINLRENEILDKSDLARIIDVYLWIIPLTIILPWLLGVGVSTYKTAGFKGFYLANNGISFLLSILMFIATYRLLHHVKIRSFLEYLSVFVSCVLVASMSCLGSILLSVILCLYIKYKGKIAKKIISIIKIALALMIVGIGVFYNYHDELMATYDRRAYFFEYHERIIDFITSGRFAKAEDIYDMSQKKESIIISTIGQGRQDIIAEFDYYDFVMQYGIIGVVAVVFVLYKCKRYVYNYDNIFKYLIFFSVVYAGIVGHVYNNAMSSMLLALIVCAYNRNNVKKISHTSSNNRRIIL